MAVIDSVSETLVALLNPRLDPLLAAPGEPSAKILDLQFNVPNSPAIVTVFLFDASEDPSARNRPRVRQDIIGDIRLRKPDMALQLRYLLTPWSQQVATEQKMLTVILQTFYDNAIIQGPQLKGDLAGTSVALKVTLAQMPAEDRMRIWHTLNKPFKLSLMYDVRVVPVATLTDETLTPVQRRSLQYGEATA